MLINASAVTNEESIISRHLEIARDGFLALEKITEFCCSGCGLCISICPPESLKFNVTTAASVILPALEAFYHCPKFKPLTSENQMEKRSNV
jgi:ferredoxin